MRIPIAILAILCIACPAILAETTAPQPIAVAGNDMLANSFRVVWGLLIVLGIILILYGLLRKRFSLLSSLPDKEIKIVEIKPLMGKKALCLVEVRGKEYLLGLTDSHISNIATLPGKNVTSFSDTLKQESGSEDE
ncbi:flagellar biosynthetic protein FliO [Desulforhopalus sp. 52FAK]